MPRPLTTCLCLLTVACVAAVLCPAATAQSNPLERQAGEPAATGALDTNGAAVAVPDWVQPGMQAAYRVTTSYGQTSSGVAVYEVAHVTPQGVLVQTTQYNEAPNVRPGLFLQGGQVVALGSMAIRSGAGFFIPVEDLHALQSSDATVVTRETYPINGQPLDVIARTTAGRNRTTYTGGNDNRAIGRETDQFVHADAFEVNSGILVSRRVRAADGAALLDRDGRPAVTQTRVAAGSLEVLIGSRQTQHAWRGQPWAAWTATAQQLRFTGTVTLTMAATPNRPVVSPCEMTFDITQRGEGYVLGTSTQTLSLPDGRSQTTQLQVLVSNNLLGGLWMSPRALADLPEGLVDEDPFSGTQTTAQRQGDSVLLTAQTTAGDRMATTYDAGSGLATRLVVETNLVNRMVLDLQLAEWR